METFLTTTQYDPVKTAELLSGVRHGFPLHYEGPQRTRISRNHRSAVLQPKTVAEKLAKEITFGRIAGPFEHPPFPSFQAHPLGLVPKSQPGQYRLIHDLSFPLGDSINSHISREFTSVVYETLDQVIEMVRTLGPGCLIAKADIRDAFRLLPVRPADYPLLGISWGRHYFHDKNLPMGASVSPKHFEKLSCALQHILQCYFGVEFVTHLLDDFIFLGTPESDECLNALAAFEALAALLGIPLSIEKRCLPDNCQIVYGLELDTEKMEIRLPTDKLEKANNLVTQYLSSRKIRLRDLQSLIGFLHFCCLACPIGRPFLRRLIDLSIGIARPHHFVTLNSEARADLKAWKIFLSSFNGKAMFLDPSIIPSDAIKLYTDSSSNHGFGAVFGKKWLAGTWHRPFASGDITLLELYPLVLVTEIFGRYLANHRVLFMTDNAAVVEIVNKMTSRNKPIMKLVRKLVVACLRYNLYVKGQHVPGYQNIIVDKISRLQIEAALAAAPWLERTPTPIPCHLTPASLLD